MPAFRPFGADHWAVLAITAAVAAAIAGNASRIRRLRDDRVARMAVAVILLGNEVGGCFVYGFTHGAWRVPLQLCDLAMFAMAWALLGGPRLVTDVALCWGVGASLHAVLTPDLVAGFPSLDWLTFFLGHCLIVWSAVYLMARGPLTSRSDVRDSVPDMLRMSRGPRPLTVGSAWRVWGLTNGYVAIVGLLNWRLGTNFGYLSGKPAHPSVLDYLGPWPVYLLGMEAIGALSFVLCVGVNRMVDRLATAPAAKGLRHA